eukprot:GEMP01065621.1.p1 GENE.GEMP01065621.1~~GEMP01065621.1.p1  ORF type:complete len:131 (+),score=35.60 GEMP01065621.1:411-803(+)
MEACDKWLDQVRNEDYGEADFSSLITRTQKEVARALHTILRGSVEDSKPSPRMPTADTARGKAAREPGGKKIGPAEDNEKPYTSGAVQLSIDESGGHTVDLQQWSFGTYSCAFQRLNAQQIRDHQTQNDP